MLFLYCSHEKAKTHSAIAIKDLEQSIMVLRQKFIDGQQEDHLPGAETPNVMDHGALDGERAQHPNWLSKKL